MIHTRTHAHTHTCKVCVKYFLETKDRTLFLPQVFHLPIEALVIIFSIEELNLLKRVGTRQIAAYRRMNGQEGVESGSASFLRTNYQESRQLIASFILRPDLLMPQIIAGIL